MRARIIVFCPVINLSFVLHNKAVFMRQALELNLKKIAAEALLREEENFAFRSFLKGCDPQETDEKVHHLNKDISAHIDCTTCGNCCRTFMISLDNEDIVRSSAYVDMQPDEFKRKYLEESSEGNYIFSRIPCHFLHENKCTIYEGRPEDCRSFPHLHKKGFTSRLLSAIDHYGICPIVYNVMEALKAETGFRYRTSR